MVTAFQIIMLIVIVVGFIGALGEKEDIDLRHTMLAMFFAALAAFIVSVVML